MSDAYEPLRKKMIREQLMARHIDNEKVLTAMYRVPRHLFVHRDFQKSAYDDRPLPIGNDQTISQPFMVALMTQLLELTGDEKVLEIGTGSGYQTAVLAEIAGFVYSIERHEALARQALNRLRKLGYDNVEVLVGDGTQGLPSKAPYDAILVAATGPIIPGPLRTQMADGGRMVLPVGEGDDQHLLRVWRAGDRWEVEKILKVRFVPLLGRFGFVED
jgi:protein-L-isoaspartate(D-aspartate) O-methyltransferase